MLAWPISCRPHKQQRTSLLLEATDCSCCAQPLCEYSNLQASPWAGVVYW